VQAPLRGGEQSHLVAQALRDVRQWAEDPLGVLQSVSEARLEPVVRRMLLFLCLFDELMNGFR
jgi:hypothetical protein